MQPFQLFQAGTLRCFFQETCLSFPAEGSFPFFQQGGENVFPRRFLAVRGQKAFLQFQKHTMEARHHQIRFVGLLEIFGQPAQQQPHHAQAFIEGRFLQLCHGLLRIFAPQNIVHPVVGTIFFIQIQVIGKILGDFLMLQILIHQPFIHGQVHFLIDLQNGGQILPAPGGHEAFAVHRSFHGVKMVLSDFQIRSNGTVNALFIGVFLPDGEVRFYVDFLHTVQCHHIEFPDAFVIFRGVACGGDKPAIGHLMGAEGLCLQKLQHSRGQCFGGAVDLVDK